MKRGKDEDKVIGPMFPRLHVNEIDKGGPRAPPRNKMALYEQLSIPSKRFIHTVPPQNLSSSDLVPSSNQECGSDKAMFFSRHLPPIHQSEKQCSRYSDLITPLTHVDKRNELDDEDFRVPIFIHSITSMEHVKHVDDSSTYKHSLSSYFNPSLKIQKAKILKEDNLKELEADQVKAVSNSGFSEKTEVEQKQADLSPRHETGAKPVNTIERLKTDSNAQLELRSESQITSNYVLRENISTVDKRGSSPTMRVLSYETKSHEDGSCGSPRVVHLGIGGNVSETTISDSMTRLDITPDDIVGVIGQEHFWKARRAISNQQRMFSDQIFELHRLIKVQRSIATSSQFLREDIIHRTKPIKVSPGKKLPLDYHVTALPNISNQKSSSEKPSHKEGSAENTVGKLSSTSLENTTMPSQYKPSNNESSSLSITSNHRTGPMYFNQPHGSHWLIPVMSPSEGLVYKPYPGPAFACGGWGPPGSNAMPPNNFSSPAYGVPAPYPQYQFPSFPVAGPHTYFPAYGMPVIDTASFSGSSIEQANQLKIRMQFSLGSAPSQSNIGDSASVNLHAPADIEVQVSSASSLSKRTQGSESGNAKEGRNKHRLFPKSPADPEPHIPVIKVVPHKAGSVNESVARIFRSIQEERKQHSSI